MSDDGGTAGPSTASRRLPKEIYVLVAAAFIVALGYGIIAPVLPQFAASFNFGVTAATIVVSSFAFFRFVFSPSSGRLVDAFGERRIYLTGLLIVAGSTAAVAFAQNYWQLLIFRGLGGIGSTMFSVSAMALIIRLAPLDARAKATSTYATAFLVGNIAGPVLGGAMAGWGMRIPFIIYAVGLLIAAIVVRVFLASTASEGSATKLGRARLEATKDETQMEVMTFRQAWRDSAYRAALISAFVQGWSAMGIRVAIYPLFAVQALRADTAVAGLALTMFAIGNASAVTVVGRYADTYGRKPFIQWGLFILGVTTAGLAFTDAIWLFFVLSVLAGAGSGLANPAQQATVADVIGRDRKGGRVLAKYQMALDAGAIVGPIIAGSVVDHFDYSWAFAVTGLLGVLAAVYWFAGRETRPRVVRRAEQDGRIEDDLS
ncbi:MFS transporter [Brevibacterium marinum]|uniref:MFS family permease n=1 Tax=Brevibacterium marinum TaxID=418643 RepID=A0A846SAR3_9MICO|nr:MFS transporter [Brevibacterium marinum]NJC58382.1 MFS family permease [Brevibacterium marinum]